MLARALLLASVIPLLVGGSAGELRLDASSNEAVVASMDRMTASMRPEDRGSFVGEVWTALFPRRRRCGLGTTQWSSGRAYPMARIAKPLHGRTVAEIRTLAAAALAEAAAREEPIAVAERENATLRARIDAARVHIRQ